MLIEYQTYLKTRLKISLPSGKLANVPSDVFFFKNKTSEDKDSTGSVLQRDVFINLNPHPETIFISVKDLYQKFNTFWGCSIYIYLYVLVTICAFQ